MTRVYTVRVTRVDGHVQYLTPIHFRSTALFLIETLAKMHPGAKFNLTSHVTFVTSTKAMYA